MLKSHRFGLVAALVALAVVADANSALAQRRGSISVGNSNNNNNNQNNNNQDGKNRNRSRDNDNNSNDKKKSDGQTFQNLIQGGGQNNNNKSQQYRNLNNQGSDKFKNQDVQQTFKNQQGVQQFIQNGQGGQGQNWQNQKYSKHNDLQKWVVGFNGGPKPFSNDWYKNHPNAWHWHNNDNWEVATAAGVVGWLGWQAVRPYNNNTVYIYDPVPMQNFVVNGPQQGNPGDWMTLGSYSLMTGSGDPGTRILQLSVDKQGNIRGSYYDMITNNTNNVVGVIDKNTQQVRWTLDTNRQLTFVATLDQLTEPQGVVNVKLPGGQVQQWQLVRMDNATASN